MRNVTDRVSNPFGMRAPRFVDEGRAAVYGYGDANADFHVVGDHPGVHGGAETGVPFTGTEAGERLQSVLHDVDLLTEPYSDEPAARNVFMSYLHMSTVEDGGEPTREQYGRLEPFLDAELRAIAAHVLLPVGERAVRYVLREHTTRPETTDVAEIHGTRIRGRGFVVVPAADPAAWPDDGDELREALAGVIATDYRQVSDLGRFMADSEPYLVR